MNDQVVRIVALINVEVGVAVEMVFQKLMKKNCWVQSLELGANSRTCLKDCGRHAGCTTIDCIDYAQFWKGAKTHKGEKWVKQSSTNWRPYLDKSIGLQVLRATNFWVERCHSRVENLFRCSEWLHWVLGALIIGNHDCC